MGQRCRDGSEVHGTVDLPPYLAFQVLIHWPQNITAFLLDQNQQFEEVKQRLVYARESLDPARYVVIIFLAFPVVTWHFQITEPRLINLVRCPYYRNIS